MLLPGTMIFGAGGQLGRELSRIMPDAAAFVHSGPGHILHVDNAGELDDAFRSIQPDIVINASAMTDVDGCETDKNRAYAVNARAVLDIATLCRKHGSIFYHISTDYVFSGREGNYSESSIPDPINYYGFSKSMGDAFALSCENSLVIRTSGVYGYSRNFPMFVYQSLAAGKRVSVIKGFYSPIHARSLATAIADIAGNHEDLTGTINIAGERMSRMQLAQSIAGKFHLDSGLISEVDGIAGLRAARPFDSSLDISYAKSILKSDFYSLDHNLDLFGISMTGEKK